MSSTPLSACTHGGHCGLSVYLVCYKELVYRTAAHLCADRLHTCRATYWSFLVAIIVIFLLNRFVIVAWVGNSYVSDGDQVLRPSGWFAFLIITSITNLVLGLVGVADMHLACADQARQT